MKKIFIGLLILGSFSSFACEYGRNWSNRAIKVVKSAYDQELTDIDVSYVEDHSNPLQFSNSGQCDGYIRGVVKVDFSLYNKEKCVAKVIIKDGNARKQSNKIAFIKNIDCK